MSPTKEEIFTEGEVLDFAWLFWADTQVCKDNELCERGPMWSGEGSKEKVVWNKARQEWGPHIAGLDK